jgi:hypothetical protein
MKQRKEEFKTFLDHNFGKYITDILLNKTTLSLNQGCSDDLYQGDLDKNKEQVLKLVEKSNHDEIKKFDWAFDFPGWIGTLDFSKENVKDILVIGMEPHIGEGCRTAQVTYGLRETFENEFCELGEYRSNRILWNNLKSLFSNDSKYYSESDFKENKIDREFLQRIYITDLSHFAVKGNAKEIQNVLNWKEIREENAKRYISETINLIKPKFIVSQGNEVANFIDNYFKDYCKGDEMKPDEFNIEKSPRYVNFPHFKSYEYKSNLFIHLKLPHLASGLTNGFWLPNTKNVTEEKNKIRTEKRELKMKEIRKKLNDFEILTK